MLLSAVGRDEAGQELIRACEMMDLITTHIYRSDDLPTDVYMAIEAANGLIAAIADAHSLEAAGARILTPLVLQITRLSCDCGATARHVVYDGRWRGSDRSPPGRCGPSPSMVAPVFSADLNGYMGFGLA